MKRTIFGIVGFFALMLASSAFTQRITAPAVGYYVPNLSVGNTDSTETTSLAAYQQWIDSEKSETRGKKIELVAVNLDSNKRMFEEIVKRDHLDRTQQFHIGAEQASFVIEDFQLGAQTKSFLIDPDGRIVAINPTTDQLNQI